MGYSESRPLTGSITCKTLSAQLKELEADGLDHPGSQYPQIPPKVEYSLSDKGRWLYPIMGAVCHWGKGYQPAE